MPYVDSDGWKIWYEVEGSGPDLVLCGGPIMMHNQFDYVRDDLARDFRIIHWNWRGAGNSERTWMSGITFDHWISDLTRVLDHVQSRKANFWGGSSGSLFAARFAARYPDRVNRMVLFPAIRGGTPDGQTFLRELVRRQGVERQIWNAYWVATSEEAFKSGSILKLIDTEIEIARRNLPQEISARISEVYIDLDLSPDIQRLQMPILLQVGGSGRNGASSPAVSAAIKSFRSLCPHAELEIIPAAGGTLAMVEQLELALASVRRFLLGKPGA